MSFQIPLSGINAALTGLRTTANNIANANTEGFRASRVEFEALSVDGVGRGVQVAKIARQETQGGVNLAEQLLEMIKYSQQIQAQASVIGTEARNADAVADLFVKRDSK